MADQLPPINGRQTIVGADGAPKPAFVLWLNQLLAKVVAAGAATAASVKAQLDAFLLTTVTSTTLAVTGKYDPTVKVSVDLKALVVDPTGTYGDATNSARVTIDKYGRVTAASQVPISGGGGGGGRTVCPLTGTDQSVSGSGFATKGVTITGLMNKFTLHGVVFYFAAISAATYKVSVLIVNTSTKAIISVLGTSPTVSFTSLPSAGRQFILSADVTLDPSTLAANQAFSIVVTRTDSTTNYTMPMLGSSEASFIIAGTTAQRFSAATLASINPTVAQVLDTATGGPGYRMALIGAENV